MDEAVDKFYKTLNECFLLHFPILNYNNKNEYCPVWYSTPFIKIIQEKSKLHHRWKSTGNPRTMMSFFTPSKTPSSSGSMS